MSRFAIFNMVFFVIMPGVTAMGFTQTDWDKYLGNPVLDVGSAGSWDDVSSGMGTVLFDGATYHMWYAGLDGFNSRIGHATSSDGISWTKDPLNPVLDLGTPGSWDDNHVYLPCVLVVGSTFHMWYDGNDGSKERIGHATSPDGISWTRDPLNPVLDVGSPGSWDDTEVFPAAGSVIFDGNDYHLWYGGVNNTTSIYAIGHATSPDGINWTKDALNPVMGIGTSGAWDDGGVIPGTVSFDGTSYHAWYSGHGGDYRYRVGYATSPDGINWTKDILNNPVLDFGTAGSWDSNQAWNGSVLFDSTANTYKMWYDGGPFFSERMGYATSVSTGIDDNSFIKLPSRFELSQSYPNPFNPSTTISYQVPRRSEVQIEIYNTLGQKVRTLLNARKEPGTYQAIWDGRNDSGVQVGSGVYLYRMAAGDPSTGSGQGFVQTRKMILLK